MSAARQDVVNEYKIPSNYPEHAAVVRVHGPPGPKRGAQVKVSMKPNPLVAPVDDDIRQVFAQYDSDCSGYIELKELEHATAALTPTHQPKPSPKPAHATTQTRALLPRARGHHHAHTTPSARQVSTLPGSYHAEAHTVAPSRHTPWASTLQARTARPRARPRCELDPRVRIPQELQHAQHNAPASWQPRAEARPLAPAQRVRLAALGGSRYSQEESPAALRTHCSHRTRCAPSLVRPEVAW